MRRFDRAVLALIQRLSTAMPYVDVRAQRWQELAKGQEGLLEVRSDAHAVSLSLAHATAAIQHAPEYAQAAKALRSDSDFKDASTSAGYWGTLDGLVNQIARQTGRMRRGGVVFDANHVLRVLAEIRKTLRASQIRYEVTRARFNTFAAR